jgi:hypothetical protein
MTTNHLDRAGATASFICAVHCALMPLVITLLPLVGLGWLADERIEWALVIAAGIMGVSSLCLGYRVHRNRRAFAALSVALVLLASGRIAEHHKMGWIGVAMVVCGGLTMVIAHALNYKLCRTCHSCSHS